MTRAEDLVATLFLIYGMLFFIKYSLVGIAFSFVFSIITVIICAVKKVFKRKNKLWNFLVKLYYPLIIIVFLLQGFILGTYYGTRELIEHETTSVSEEPLYGTFLNIAMVFKNYLVEEVDTNKIDNYSIAGLSKDFLSKGNEDKTLIKLIGESKFYNYFSEIIYCFVDYHKKNDAANFTDKTDVEIFLSLDLINLDLDAERTIHTNLEKITKAFLKEVLKKSVFYLSLILLIPILDTIIYFTFYKKVNEN